MVKLTEALPEELLIHGVKYKINTDFRYWLRLIDEQDYKPIFVNKIPIPSEELFAEINNFIACGNVDKKEDEHTPELLDFTLDADYIFASFYQAYNINLLRDKLHWYEFISLLKGLPEDTIMQKIIGYRQYNGDDEELKKLNSIYELPHKLSEAEEEAGEYFEEVFA